MKGYPTAPFVYGQAVLAASATKIIGVNPQRSGILLINMSAIDIYIGDYQVLTSTGLLLTGTKGAGVSIPSTGEIWAIPASGTPSVSWMEIFNSMRTII